MTSNTDNTSSLSSGMDPVTFEVIRNAVVNLTEEMAVTVRRAAFSTNIKTRADFSCAFFRCQTTLRSTVICAARTPGRYVDHHTRIDP
jgi:hypothetical protein